MDHDLFLASLRERNACTCYMLPLLRIEPYIFGGNTNILNSYISKDGMRLGVMVNTTVFTLTHKLPKHTIYKYVRDNDATYIVYLFDLPKKKMDDILLFFEGKYSHFSDTTKDLIRRYAGLSDKELQCDGSTHTSVWLLALERSPQVRRLWNEILYDRDSDSVLSDESELMSRPDESCYLENILSDVVSQKSALP